MLTRTTNYFCRRSFLYNNARSMAISRVEVFDRVAKRRQKDRASLEPESKKTDYLKDEVADRIYERMYDINRNFSKALELGSGSGHLVKFATSDKIKSLIQCDTSLGMLTRDDPNQYEITPSRVVADEEFLPFADKSFDAVISNLNLHWTNDLKGALKEIVRVLDQDCLFMGTMFCDESLYQLRCSLQLAETERKGGFTPRMAPLVRSGEIGAIMTEAGLKLLTVDVEHITVNYPSMFELIQDLRLMGESNCTINRTHTLSQDTLLAASAIYQEMYGNEDGTIPATFEVVFMTGWTFSPSQQAPNKPGAAAVSLKDLTDTPTGEF